MRFYHATVTALYGSDAFVTLLITVPRLLWSAPGTVGAAVGLVLLMAMFHVGPVGAEPTSPDRQPSPARVTDPAAIRPATPALFGPSEPRLPQPTPPAPSSARIGTHGGPAQVVGPSRGEQAAATALRHIGAPYRWGGASPAGFDCSGFVLFVYASLGIALPHDVPGQLAAGRRVAMDALLPGDVVIFRDTYRPGLSHSGIYLGEARFAHAADERHGVTVSSMQDDYWRPRLSGAARPELGGPPRPPK